MPFKFMNKIISEEPQESIPGLNCSVDMYLDPRIAGMRPMYCCESTEEQPINEGRGICLMRVGSLYALPVINHYGAANQCLQCIW